MAKKKLPMPMRRSALNRMVSTYCGRYPKSADELAEMLPEERIEFVAEVCIRMLRDAQYVIKYREVNDKSGRFRWWTRSMERAGQFNHAESFELVKIDAARELQVETLHDLVFLDRTDKDDET